MPEMDDFVKWVQMVRATFRKAMEDPTSELYIEGDHELSMMVFLLIIITKPDFPGSEMAFDMIVRNRSKELNLPLHDTLRNAMGQDLNFEMWMRRN